MKSEVCKRTGAERKAAGFAIFLLLAALFPVMYLGRYNHPTGDDYYYGAETHRVWQETGSIIETVAEAGRGVAREYGQWQGTYSALFFMYLPPNIFGNLPYRFVTAGILLLLAGGIFYLGRMLLCHRLQVSTPAWLAVSACLTVLCVETVPSQGESFFWYNGSMYYTGYFALTLLFFGEVLRYLERQSHVRLAGLIFTAFFLAGGNYVTLLPCILVLVLLSGWLLRQKKPGARGLLTVTLFALGGLLISAGAPGNRVRQDGMWKIPAWKAVAKALVQGIRYTGAWVTFWWLLAALILTVLLWKYFQKSTFRFPCPLVAVGLLYGIFCSMSCPTFYTMNSTGPARAVAAVYYGFVLFSMLAYGYLLGYVLRWQRERKMVKTGAAKAASTKAAERQLEEESMCMASAKRLPAEAFAGKKVRCLPGVAAAGTAAALCAGLLLTGELRDCTTGKAITLLVSGEAAAYEQEYQERYRLFTDSREQELVLKPYLNQPEMLYVGDFAADAEEPTNQKLARFFEKISVRVEY